MYSFRKIKEFAKKAINRFNYPTYKFTEAQQLLIKPFDRLKFIIFFILTTNLVQIITNFILNQRGLDFLWDNENQYLIAIITGIITGSIVVINCTGNIIIYEGMNQVSIDNVDQTPLPQVVTHSSYEDMVVGEAVTEVAKFLVEFTLPSQIAIHSWRGIPLFWLGITTYAVIFGISILIVKIPI